MHDMSLKETIRYNKSGPARYCCRPEVWDEVEHLLVPFGRKTIVSGGNRARASIQDKLYPALEAAGIEYMVHEFSGESSMVNVQKLVDKCEQYHPDYILGCGGGKSLDTAKYAAEIYGVPVITIPTIAATCAGTSNQIIVYSDEGEYLENVYPRTNPALAIVDPTVILKAPRPYLISGIYDSLAKWYEGSASYPGSDNSDIFDVTALAVAKMLKDSYYQETLKAVNDFDHQVLSKEFIDIVNLNIYTAAMVQALGIKAVRNGIAHATQNGLTTLPGAHSITHGEKVAYGIAVQLMVTQAPQEEVDELFGFYRAMDFTPTFKAFHIPFTEENIVSVAHKAVIDVLMTSKPFDVITEDMMVAAIKKLESLF
ncbi:MAG: iron-containing alcohol dehydrogenase family protein [Blautia sp.]|nr:iron-containing alcohol dehydrogenase family protein [Blautia sp.]